MLLWGRTLPAGKEADDEICRRRERGTTPTTATDEIDRLRLRYGFWIITAGFALVALITIVSKFRLAEVTSGGTVVGAVASLVGTVVGVFFGVQVGAVGKERAEASRERSDELARAAGKALVGAQSLCRLGRPGTDGGCVGGAVWCGGFCWWGWGCV
jgi:hypothetical protein